MKHYDRHIVIIGGVGTALNIIEQIIDARDNHSLKINLEGIIIDSLEAGTKIAGVEVIGGKDYISYLLKEPDIEFLFCLFKPGEMKKRYDLMIDIGIPFERYTNFIHPMAYVAGSVRMGVGNIIMSHSSVHSNVLIGNMNIINSNVTVEHETIIGDGNFFAANSCIGSKVNIDNHCFIGLNSSVRENINLGENVFIGMHSLVISDFTNCNIAGVPATILNK